MDEDQDISMSALEDAQALYHAGKRENTMNDVCKGSFNFLKLEPKHPDRSYWEEVYKRANELRDQYKKIREVL